MWPHECRSHGMMVDKSSCRRVVGGDRNNLCSPRPEHSRHSAGRGVTRPCDGSSAWDTHWLSWILGLRQRPLLINFPAQTSVPAPGPAGSEGLPSPSEAGPDGAAASPSAGLAAGASGLSGVREERVWKTRREQVLETLSLQLCQLCLTHGGEKCCEPGKPSKPSWASGLGQSAVASRVWHCWQHFWGRCEAWDVLPHLLLLL